MARSALPMNPVWSMGTHRESHNRCCGRSATLDVDAISWWGGVLTLMPFDGKVDTYLTVLRPVVANGRANCD